MFILQKNYQDAYLINPFHLVRFMIENARDPPEFMGIASTFLIILRLMASRLFHCVGKCLADLRFNLFAELEIVCEKILDGLASLSKFAVTVAEP